MYSTTKLQPHHEGWLSIVYTDYLTACRDSRDQLRPRGLIGKHKFTALPSLLRASVDALSLGWLGTVCNLSLFTLIYVKPRLK